MLFAKDSIFEHYTTQLVLCPGAACVRLPARNGLVNEVEFLGLNIISYPNMVMTNEIVS